MPSESVPFERYRGGHVITVPVRLADSVPARFVLDTGIGLPIVSAALARREGWPETGATGSGRRMSGQLVSAPLVRIPSISIGSLRRENVLAGMLDLGTFLPPESGIEGFLAPSVFEPWPFAINSVTGTVRLLRGDDAGAPLGVGVEAPVFRHREGDGISYFLDLRLPSGSIARVEIDTGTDSLILHTRYMRELGVDPGRAGVVERHGEDETGHAYTRWFATVRGAFRVAAAPSICQNDPAVMFQEIIYDGLIGDAFLRSYDVTYDLARSRLIFANPTP